ncbi:hypothetical protein [Brevibacillus centrosporus]|uniref:hypothetical protein n=1 Tax=Brevibacillus centrosporus TaxID=54910 RepID=UPI003B016C1C
MSGFHSFGHSFGAGGGASGASASLEELRSILPIYPGETVKIGDTAEVRDGEIYRSLQKIGTTRAVADIGLGTVEGILGANLVMMPLDNKRALCFYVRYYPGSPNRYALEGFIMTDNGDSVGMTAAQLIIDNANFIISMELMELDAGKYLLTYKNTTTNKLQGTVVTVTGDTISFASTFDISTGAVNANTYLACCRMAKNKVLASYNDLVRVITFEGALATLFPEYDHMYDSANSYIAQDRKLVAISETNAVMFYKINSNANLPLNAKPIKINPDNTCVTSDLTKSTGYSINSYEFQNFYGNNAVLFDGNKVAFMAKCQHVDRNRGTYVFITEVTEDGMKITTKMELYMGSDGSTNGGLFYVGKDTEGSFYFVSHFYANSNSYLRLLRVAKDFSSSAFEFLYTGVHLEQATSWLVSCCLNNHRVMTLSYAGTSKRMISSLHDSRIAMPTGIITQAVQGGANAEIQQQGVVRILENLIPCVEYFGNEDGKLATIPMRSLNQTNRLNKIGVSLSPTELFIGEAIRR